MKVYGEDDVSAAALEDRRIAVIGYGSQGRAHAQNLRDTGYDVVAGVRKGGKGWTNARADKIDTAEPAEAVEGADLIAFLTPGHGAGSDLQRDHRAKRQDKAQHCSSRTAFPSTMAA